MKQSRDASIALLDLNVLEASPDEDHASCVKTWMEKLNRACGIMIFFSWELYCHQSINRQLKACLHTVHYLSVFQLKLWGVSCSSINCNPPEFLVKFRAKITGRYFLQGMLPKTSSNRWRRRLKRYSEARRSGLRNSQSSQVHFSYNCYWKLEVWQLNVSFHYFRSRSKTIRSRSP